MKARGDSVAQITRRSRLSPIACNLADPRLGNPSEYDAAAADEQLLLYRLCFQIEEKHYWVMMFTLDHSREGRVGRSHDPKGNISQLRRSGKSRFGSGENRIRSCRGSC